jgi:fatty acid-binding protein DegV
MMKAYNKAFWDMTPCRVIVIHISKELSGTMFRVIHTDSEDRGNTVYIYYLYLNFSVFRVYDLTFFIQGAKIFF